MSTKFFGIGAVVIVGLTAVAGGYAVLRDGAPVAQVIPAAPSSGALATAPLPAPTTPSFLDAAPPTVRANVQARTSQAAPAPQERVALTPPAAPEQPPAQPASPVVPPPPGGVAPVSAPAERYVPTLDPALQPAAPPTPVIEAAPDYEELTVARHSVIGIRLDSEVSTRTARVEDRISASVSRDVTVDGRVVIPIDAKLEGTVTTVERGGKFRDRPRLGLRFDTMILADGTRLSISTDTIFREGDSPAADAASKVGGGAVAGAILGAVLGGKKGAAIGGAAGAAGGTAAVMRSDGEEAALRAGAPLTVRLTGDITVQVKR